MEIVIKLVTILITITISALLLALPTMWLWNYLMPAIFQLTEISFWQALAINFLSGILFGANNSSSTKKSN